MSGVNSQRRRFLRGAYNAWAAAISEAIINPTTNIPELAKDFGEATTDLATLGEVRRWFNWAVIDKMILKLKEKR